VSRDPRVDAYIAKAQPFAQAILAHVRKRVHAAPAYTLDGKILLITAAFKAHAALNFWRGQEIREGASDAEDEGMGQFGKLKSIDDLPPDGELDALIRKAAELAKNAPTPRKAKATPKPAPDMHPEFAAALDRAPKARAALESFPPSARRDYLEWVADAKQDATRQKRIASAIEWLSEGKRRNWKYESC